MVGGEADFSPVPSSAVRIFPGVTQLVSWVVAVAVSLAS